MLFKKSNSVKSLETIRALSKTLLINESMKKKVKGGAPDDKTERPFP